MGGLMKIRRPVSLLFLAVLPSALAASTLRSAAARHGLLMGAATNVAGLANESEPQYRLTEQAEFALTTAENSCKVGPTHPAPDRYDFSGCDAVFAAARSANQSVRGHNLCWHQQNPSWLNSSLTPEQLIAALQGHISTVVGRYRRQAYAFDVVNEAISDSPASVIKREFAPWLPKVPDFIDRAFKYARQAAGPDGPLLFYNDYGIEQLGSKSDRLYGFIKSMLSRGIPIDGIGFQTHISIKTFGKSQLDSMERNLARFSALGLQLHITELDVRACDQHSSCDQAALSKQAELYSGLLQMCLRNKACKVFEMWGFTDRHTWTRGFQNPTGKNEMPLPFDLDYKKKPCYFAMLKVLQSEIQARQAM